LKPDSRVNLRVRNRTTVGMSYWFPHQGTASTALPIDHNGQAFDSLAPTQPLQKKIAVHALINS
jgi:hypothetical protein